MQIQDKELFLKYAIPCGEVLVGRGKITKKKLREIKESLINKKPIKEDLESIFTIGVRLCYLIAKEMKKNVIDKEVIHKYFWHEHGDVIVWRSKTHPDVLRSNCIVLPAKILSSNKNKAVVKTPLGEKTVNLEFLENIKEGDYVTVHYSYACEKITKKQADELWKLGEKCA